MVNEESFILVSLEEKKAKKLAEVISNDTCRRILEFLTKEEATETKLSKELGLPISTIHYNLKHLVEANLVKVDEFHYSEKGKEVNHYSISNKLIIIAPKSAESSKIKESLKKIWPVGLIALLVSGVMQLIYTLSANKTLVRSAAGALAKNAPVAAEMEAVSLAKDSASASQGGSVAISFFQSNFVIWFFIGAIFAVLLYFVFELARKKS